MALCLPRTASFHNYGHFGGRNFISCGIPSPAAQSSTRQRRESARSQAIFPRRHCERSQATFRERHCERSEATKGFREITDVAGQRLAIKRGFPVPWVASLTLAMTAMGRCLFFGIPSPTAHSSISPHTVSARSQTIFPCRHCERSQATFRDRHCERSEATQGFREITDVAGQLLAIKRGFPAPWVASLTLAMTASGGYLFALAMTASGGGFLAFAFAIMGGEATDEVAR